MSKVEWPVIVLAAATANEEVSVLAEGLGGLGTVALLAPQPPPRHGRDTAFVPADLASETAVANAWHAAESRNGPAEALVSVPPPIAGTPVPFAEIGDALWSSILRDNLTAAMHVARVAARAMTVRGRGRIILVTWDPASVAGLVPLATVSGSICQMARALAAEVGADGVTVNAVSVAPGRLADVGPTARFLCSPESGYLTAEVLRLATGPAPQGPSR